LSTSEDRPDTSEDFRRSPEHFPGFPKTCDNLRRSPKITEYFRSFPKFRKIEGPVFFFRDSYCSFPCKAVLPHELYNSSDSQIGLGLRLRPILAVLGIFFKKSNYFQIGQHVVLLHIQNGLDVGISTSASSRTTIKMFPFSYAWAYACVCAATSKSEISLRHNTSTRIFTTRGYIWIMKILNPY